MHLLSRFFDQSFFFASFLHFFSAAVIGVLIAEALQVYVGVTHPDPELNVPWAPRSVGNEPVRFEVLNLRLTMGSGVGNWRYEEMVQLFPGASVKTKQVTPEKLGVTARLTVPPPECVPL